MIRCACDGPGFARPFGGTVMWPKTIVGLALLLGRDPLVYSLFEQVERQRPVINHCIAELTALGGFGAQFLDLQPRKAKVALAVSALGITFRLDL